MTLLQFFGNPNLMTNVDHWVLSLALLHGLVYNIPEMTDFTRSALGSRQLRTIYSLFHNHSSQPVPLPCQLDCWWEGGGGGQHRTQLFRKKRHSATEATWRLLMKMYIYLHNHKKSFSHFTWYWLQSVLEEELGMLAPLTGVPAVKQDIDIAINVLLHSSSLKKCNTREAPEWMLVVAPLHGSS